MHYARHMVLLRKIVTCKLYIQHWACYKKIVSISAISNFAVIFSSIEWIEQVRLRIYIACVAFTAINTDSY